jgi:hypothetical protein
MVRKASRAVPFLLLAVSVPALAQYVGTPQPGQTSAAPSATQAENLTITAKNGQTQEQQWADRYECHRWAKNQSGFDPTQSAPDLTPTESAARRDQYRRAFTACLEGRGYSVRYAAPPTPAPPVPSRQPVSAKRYVPAEPEVRYRPLAVHIDGGYSVTTGMTDRYLDDGSNVGFGVTWFPTSALPIGLRVDGSYSSFTTGLTSHPDTKTSTGVMLTCNWTWRISHPTQSYTSLAGPAGTGCRPICGSCRLRRD